MKHLKLLLLIPIIFSIQLAKAQCGEKKKVPKEFVENRLSGDGNYYGHPYTIFNKKYDGFNLDSEIGNIRDQIILEKNRAVRPVYAAYTDILDEANKSYDDLKVGGVVPAATLAIWAKYNAFVLLKNDVD